ncbi:MAG TPA: hypothetical protein VJL56_06455 [Candidatus Bathyarchaeia archaeon]|nr:hypothetical protein [Candidatus Bathyarchaeia archaeon]
MRIWAIAILLVFLLPAIAVTTAAATHADQDDHLNRGMGTITFTQGATVSGPTVLNDHTTILTVKETLSFTDNLTGTAQAIERDVMHTVTDEGQPISFTTFHGSGNFTGTLGNNQVTLHIRYEGVKNSTFARGNFVVSGDTNQMIDVHGEGHFRGSLTGGVEGEGSAVNYTMHWTVSTHTEQPEASDDDSDTE